MKTKNFRYWIRAFELNNEDVLSAFPSLIDIKNIAYFALSFVKSLFMLDLAVFLTINAFEKKINVGRTFSSEFLLWITREHEVRKAFKKNDDEIIKTRRLAFVSLTDLTNINVDFATYGMKEVSNIGLDEYEYSYDDVEKMLLARYGGKDD